MTQQGAVERIRVSTAGIAADRRFEYWQRASLGTLAGLRCSSLSEHGFEASQICVKLREVRLLDVRTSSHVIERPRALIRRDPKDTLFINLLIEGSAFVYQGDRCIRQQVGDISIYSPDIPFLSGFPTPMRMLTLDLPRHRLGLPMATLQILDGTTASGRRAVEALTGLAAHLADDHGNGRDDGLDQALERAIARLRDALGVGAADASATLMRVKAFIDDHLADPDLDAGSIAGHLGISRRHLHRLFEPTGATPGAWIRGQRLLRCAAQLRDPLLKDASVTEIGFRWGFPDGAHFSRAFKAAFSRSPRDYRG